MYHSLCAICSSDLTRTIRPYFGVDLYRNLEAHRSRIHEFANERISWLREILDCSACKIKGPNREEEK